MIDKKNTPLSRCQIEFPELPGKKFMGCFEIKDNSMSIWVEFEKSNCDSKQLFSYLDKDTNFPVLLLNDNEQGYSCFGCLSLEDSRDFYTKDYGLINIFCSRWLETFHVDSEDLSFISKAYLEFPFLEYWFKDTKEEEFTAEDYIIKSINSEFLHYDTYSCTTTQKRNCYFELVFHNKKTLKEVARIEESLWLFIRFMTNIAIPRASINIKNEEGISKTHAYHFTSGPCYVIADYAKPTEYANMPVYLRDITKDKNIFSKWTKFLSNHYHAMKMWTKEMKKESYFDEKIAHYVQIVDSLRTNCREKLQEKLQHCVHNYSIYLPPVIKEDTAKNLKEIRVAFSHLGDSSFLDASIDSKTYMQYEKIIKQLIRVIITENVFEEEMLKRLINPAHKKST